MIDSGSTTILYDLHGVFPTVRLNRVPGKTVAGVSNTTSDLPADPSSTVVTVMEDSVKTRERV